MNNEIVDGFRRELSNLIENAKKGIDKMENGSKLNSILMKIKIEPDAILHEINVNTKYQAVLPLLTEEMEFLNSMYMQVEWKKWLKAVDVVLESIGKYLKLPIVDIFREVLCIAAIFSNHKKTN